MFRFVFPATDRSEVSSRASLLKMSTSTACVPRRSRHRTDTKNLKLPLQRFFSIGCFLQPVNDVIEIGHFLIASLSASVEFGALEGGDWACVLARIGAC